MINFPNAKINLGLYVTSKRDDGYHNIESIFLPVDLCDILEINENKKYTKGRKYFDLKITGIKPQCNLKENSCYKAYNLLKKKYDLPPVKVHLHKQIPFGSGLGGGSADAVFTLKNLSSLFSLNLEISDYYYFASLLGSDCFFFVENQISIVLGRGDIVKPLKDYKPDFYIVIVKPNIEVSTAAAYNDVLIAKPKIPIESIVKLNIQEWKNNIYNNFEKTICQKYPVINQLKEMLYKHGAFYSQMSGSGAAVFGLFEKEPDIEKINSENNFFVHKCKVIN